MRKKTKIINLKMANIMIENHYMNKIKNVSESIVKGKQEINYKKHKNEFDEDMLLVNHYTKNIILDNIPSLSELNFKHPDSDVDPDEYNWVLSIKIDEVIKKLEDLKKK
jgi:hypothetical protein